MTFRKLMGAVALLGLAACGDGDPMGVENIELLEQEVMEQYAQDSLTSEVVLAEGAELLRSGGGGGGHSLFERLAEAIPGFGGLYRTARCEVAVILTEDAAVDEALRIVHTALEPLVARTCADGITLEAVRGQFTYVELRRYLLASRPLHNLDGVLGAFIHVRRNRLAIVVTDRRAAAAVVRALPRVEIPRDAVVFVRGSVLRSAS